jgi:hypothetical protein
VDFEVEVVDGFDLSFFVDFGEVLGFYGGLGGCRFVFPP